MNNTIDIALKHRTIREFTNEKIDEKTINKLLEVANHSPSSNGMQFSTIIRIKNKTLKDKLAEIGGQAYMKRAPEIWIFVADLFRNYNIAKENSSENDEMIGFDKFIQAFTDSIIAAQNVAVAAESLGLGTNYYGNIHNDTQKIN